MKHEWIIERAELYLEHSADNSDCKKGFMKAIAMFGLLADSEIEKLKEKFDLYE